jgi:MoaD family protein
MQVLLFAVLREIAGASRIEVDASDVGALLGQLSARFGEPFDRVMRTGAVVVNGEASERDRVLHPGDEVALLPPVSGGHGPVASRSLAWTMRGRSVS